MTATRNVTIRYFASVREGVGREQETISTRAATVGALRDELIARGGTHARMLA
ncbi:MAG: MoaD/ThiS family protein, partial [Proteobacteria bacterium]|nr:MoaD/ThiS family protein [Pseudomonadota bacterium]